MRYALVYLAGPLAGLYNSPLDTGDEPVSAEYLTRLRSGVIAQAPDGAPIPLDAIADPPEHVGPPWWWSGAGWEPAVAIGTDWRQPTAAERLARAQAARIAAIDSEREDLLQAAGWTATIVADAVAGIPSATVQAQHRAERIATMQAAGVAQAAVRAVVVTDPADVAAALAAVASVTVVWPPLAGPGVQS